MRLLVTRPAPDAEHQAEKLADLGHAALVVPLLHIEFLENVALPLDGAQGLIATSRNAMRAFAARGRPDNAMALPLFAVGAATARLARAQGFRRVHEGDGTAEGLVPLIARQCRPEPGALVHLAGERLAGDLKGVLEKRGYAVRQPVLYRVSAAETLSAAAREALQKRNLDGVILMSPATARAYAGLVARHGLQDAAMRLHHYCLSPAVAEALEPLALPPGRAAAAARPREDDLLALIGREAAH